MAGEVERGYADMYGTRLVRALLADGRYVFTTDEAAAVASTLGIRREGLNQVLSLLSRSGWVSRLRRGLYVVSGGVPGGVDVHPFLIATRLVEPSAISHWSALNYHGLTEQVPQVVTAFTTKKTYPPSYRTGVSERSGMRPRFEVMGLSYEYTTVKPEFFFGFDEEWVDVNSRVAVTDRERTVLDGFVLPRYFGGLGTIMDVLEEHYDELDIDRLVEYAVRIGKASVIKRLGWALEYYGTSWAALAPLREFPIRGFRLLDPSLTRQGPYDNGWMIQNNLSLAGDAR